MSDGQEQSKQLQLLVDLQHHLKVKFDGKEDMILEWLRTSNQDLEGYAPVELIGAGKIEHLLAYVLKTSFKKE